MDDTTIAAHIADLEAEVEALGPGEADRRVDLEQQVDQSRDLLRQRRLRREHGEDPGLAQVDPGLPT